MIAQITRRDFLKAIAGAIILSPAFAFRRGRTAFNLLVIGDSVIWGQGLDEGQKFYSLTKSWIEKDILAGSLPVDLHVLAHSGSTIRLDQAEKAALERANRDSGEGLHPEVNVSFPTIEEQLATALQNYPDPGTVDLIMVTGGIPDVGVARIISPFESNDKLRDRIRTYCSQQFGETLHKAAGQFHNAAVAVIGYYPIITRYSPMKRIVNDILELYNVPRWSKTLLNNPLNRSIFRLWKSKMINRSRIWHEGSNQAFKEVVQALNKSSGRERAVFVSSPITERQAFGTRGSFLFSVAKKGRPADPQGPTRLRECGPALEELREETELKYRTRFCELASVGHPNPAGAAAIADAIRQSLGPLLAERVSNR